ncbi:MAG: hypothetical protein ABJB93_11265, partial [Gaiellales bacterium]
TIVNGTGTGPGTTPVTRTDIFPQNSGALQAVMDPRVLGHHQCQDTHTTVAGVPASIVANAVEGVRCQAPTAEFPRVTYDVFLYPSTKVLRQAFSGVLAYWASTGNWIRSKQACAAGPGKVFSGGPVRWLHPANPPEPPGLGGFRACYNAQSAPLMVWIHLSDNGKPQADHYDTLVAATTTNGGTLPSDLRAFWRFAGTLRTPIGKSLNSSDLPPISSFAQ